MSHDNKNHLNFLKVANSHNKIAVFKESSRYQLPSYEELGNLETNNDKGEHYKKFIDLSKSEPNISNDRQVFIKDPYMDQQKRWDNNELSNPNKDSPTIIKDPLADKKQQQYENSFINRLVGSQDVIDHIGFNENSNFTPDKDTYNIYEEIIKGKKYYNLGPGINLTSNSDYWEKLKQWGYDKNSLIAGNSSVKREHVNKLFKSHLRNKVAPELEKRMGFLNKMYKNKSINELSPLHRTAADLAYNIGNTYKFKNYRKALKNNNAVGALLNYIYTDPSKELNKSNLTGLAEDVGLRRIKNNFMPVIENATGEKKKQLQEILNNARKHF